MNTRTISITRRSIFEIQPDTGETVVLSGFVGSLFMVYGDDIQNSYTIEGSLTPTAEMSLVLGNIRGGFAWKLIPNDGTSGALNGKGNIRSMNQLVNRYGHSLELSIRGTGPIEGLSDQDDD